MRRPAGSAFAGALLAGAAGVLVLGLLSLAEPRAALAAWLAAALFVTAIPAGLFALLLVAHLHRGAWTRITGEALARGAATLPAAAVVLLPALLLAGQLYHWAEPGERDLGGWLTPELFLARGLLYLGAWWLFAYLTPPATLERRPGLASGGLIVYALTASLAGFDWALSVQPDVYSSIFGLLFIGHQMLAGFAFAVLVSLARARDRPEPAQVRGLGNMLFGGVMLWIYLEFMQYLVIWSGDLPHHTAYYLERVGGLWTGAVYLLALGGGALPFVALLSRRVRESARALVLLAALFLAMRLVEACWWVLPLYEGGWLLAPMTLAALVGAGGLWCAAWLRARPEGRRRPSAARLGGEAGG